MSSENPPPDTQRKIGVFAAFIPLYCWIPIATVLLMYQYHLVHAPKTTLKGMVTINGDQVPKGSKVLMTMDGISMNINALGPIPIGSHVFRFSMTNSTTFKTNMFVWYGVNELGTIPLQSLRGDLELSFNPIPDSIEGVGEFTTFRSYQPTTITTNIPAGAYALLMNYGQYQEEQTLIVEPNQLVSKQVRAEYGILDLQSNPEGAQFRVVNDTATRRVNRTGIFPERMTLPVGQYTISSWIDDYHKESNISVTRGATNSFSVAFEYGTFEISTKPMAVRVLSNRKEIGTTPLEVSMIPGTYEIRLESSGYSSISFPILIKENQTNSISTNLVHLGLSRAIISADRAASRGAYTTAIDFLQQALAIDPDDSELRKQLKEYEGIEAKKKHQQLIADRKKMATDIFKNTTDTVKDANLFDTYLWEFDVQFSVVSQSVKEIIEEGIHRYSLESDQPVAEGNRMLIGRAKGFRALGQQCVVLVSEVESNRTEVRAKFWEYATGKNISFSFSGFDPDSLTPIHERYFRPAQRQEINERRKQTAETFRSALATKLQQAK